MFDRDIEKPLSGGIPFQLSLVFVLYRFPCLRRVSITCHASESMFQKPRQCNKDRNQHPKYVHNLVLLLNIFYPDVYVPPQ